MKVINSALVVATLFSTVVDAQTATRMLASNAATRKTFGQPCQVTYNTAADKYQKVTGSECDTGLVCSDLNDLGVDSTPIIGVCKRESCDGTADPSVDQQTSSRRVTICHRTCSQTNPWVRITIDDDAWGGADASGCGHRQHNVTQECNKSDYSPWGPNRVDYLIKDHGTRSDVRAKNPTWTVAAEKAYWFHWERACPYVRAKKLDKPCCDWAKGECCGPHPDDKCPMDPLKMLPGQCGCGVADKDTDGDTIADCVDKCPGFNDMIDTDKDGVADGCDRCPGGNDKIDTDKDGIPDFCDVCPNNMNVNSQAGLNGCTCSATLAQLQVGCKPEVVVCPKCGCGKVDVDTDKDGVLDCFDVCPNDPTKTTSTGACGCGVAETDTDGDGVPNCIDKCPNDKNKGLTTGQCACGISEVDSDLDGTPDCKDQCPQDKNKLLEGVCGCGVSDKDSDMDGLADCLDKCPLDPLKKVVGVCGCGISDFDTDGDGVMDCKDACPTDKTKSLSIGVCGCGVSDVDTDKDGTPDCKDACQDDPTKTQPGLCGCGKNDSDNDGTCDADDKCPMDSQKKELMQCGCGVGETDSDMDLTADCVDGCPLDPIKQKPGVCGCGVPDKDSDGDKVFDCNDACPEDANKIAGGVCGCGKSDVDLDKDGTPDCVDECPNDMNKILPGTCGCGVQDLDSDGDGTKDCQDLCPKDFDKIVPGKCGCNKPDTDSDGDTVPDCLDGCKNDITKTAPGVCGCNIPDTDSDSDGTSDCNDKCPFDMSKTFPGQCGCGVADTDTDKDGTADCLDDCPLDPKKTKPGQCGCGVVDADADADGTCDHEDSCPSDPKKSALGACGCGVSDIDSDNDGTADCLDGCPADPKKTKPGTCGCGVSDIDSDGDGIADCNDGCKDDPKKTEPGTCNCGSPDVDSDGDGVLDCNDGCSTDPKKTKPLVCGCGKEDVDSDGDGTMDCVDLCPTDSNKIEAGLCGCGKQDTDSDNDKTPDCLDLCPFDATMTTDIDTDKDGTLDCNDGCKTDPKKISPGICGCGTPDVDSDNDGVMDCDEEREDITLKSSNLVGTSETYKECYKMYNAGKSDPGFSGYVEAATAFCLSDCDAGAYCIYVQAADGIHLADTEAWFKDYTSGRNSIQPIEPGIQLIYDQSGEIISWEGCFKIPAGATGEDIEIHADWGYSGSNDVGNTASTGRPNGVAMDYPECLSSPTVPTSTMTTPVGTPVASPVAIENTPVSLPTVAVTPVVSPTGADIDNDPSVGLPGANNQGDGENGGGFGDPHLKTWFGEVYDFHGACDLVLVKTPTFHNGAGLDLHIRTEIRDDWSFISSAALRIGDDVLEVGKKGYYYVNDIAGAELPTTVGGFPVSIQHYGTRRHKFEIDLGHMGIIEIKVFNEFLAVEVNNAHSDGFGDSVGLMGTFTDGSLVGRNGKIQADHNEFGLSWQVHDSDSILFQKADGPQYPQLCSMPTPKAMKSRRMSESLVSFDDAAKACADWSEETRESCIYDVMSTGDLDMAEAGAF